MGQLQEIVADLEGLGYQILFINPDKPSKLQGYASESKLDYILYSDSSAAAAKAFGIAFRVDEATRTRYKGFGIDLEEASGESHFLLPVPSVFLFNAEGVVEFSYVNPDYRLRIDPDVLLAAAKSAKR